MNEFHPKKNWINDPNGLCKYKGLYHIYYQYNPTGIKWGNIVWGHATTKDFISYKEEEIALERDNSYDKDGCFSGSSIIENDILYVYYTSVSNGKQTQSVAYSNDGFNFIKYEGNPIIILDEEFRDPYLFRYNNSIYMLLGAQNRILLYKAKDMFSFEYVSDILSINDFPECPNIMFIKGKCILKYSSIKTRDEHFLIGSFDGFKFNFEYEAKNNLPKNFYASQAFIDDGKYKLIGWIFNDNYETKESYNGKLSIPYIVDIIDKELVLI